MARVKDFVEGAIFFAVILPKKNKAIDFEIVNGTIISKLQQKYFFVSNNNGIKKSFGSGTQIVPIPERLYKALLLK